jgi:hypothetical protein
MTLLESHSEGAPGITFFSMFFMQFLFTFSFIGYKIFRQTMFEDPNFSVPRFEALLGIRKIYAFLNESWIKLSISRGL